MKTLLTVIHLTISILLIGAIVIQTKGSGLSATWGGTGASYHSKRGMERVLFAITIGLAAAFIITSLLTFLSF
jgi:preprotein translocase subunit SecG